MLSCPLVVKLSNDTHLITNSQAVLSQKPICCALGVERTCSTVVSSSPWTVEETEVKEEWQPDRTPGDPGLKEDYGAFTLNDKATEQPQQPGSHQTARCAGL